MHIIILKNKSFTLIEILIVITLLVGIFVFFSVSFIKFSKDYFTVHNDTMKIKAILEQAKDNSVIGLENQDWGVYFVNSSSAYYFFSGSSFSLSKNYAQFFLDPNNMFLNPGRNETKEIIFRKYSGFTTSTQISISSRNEKVKSIIYINNLGNINYDILK